MDKILLKIMIVCLMLGGCLQIASARPAEKTMHKEQLSAWEQKIRARARIAEHQKMKMQMQQAKLHNQDMEKQTAMTQ